MAHPFSIHGARLPYAVSQTAWNATIGSIQHRVMVVRHPHTRLLSAYISKLAINATQLFPVGYLMNSGFTALVKQVVTANRLNGHFAPQIDHCGLPNGMTYTVLRLEQMEEWCWQLACHLGYDYSGAFARKLCPTVRHDDRSTRCGGLGATGPLGLPPRGQSHTIMYTAPLCCSHPRISPRRQRTWLTCGRRTISVSLATNPSQQALGCDTFSYCCDP